LIAHIKGKGEPNYAESVSFFGYFARLDILQTRPSRPQIPPPGRKTAMIIERRIDRELRFHFVVLSRRRPRRQPRPDLGGSDLSGNDLRDIRLGKP